MDLAAIPSRHGRRAGQPNGAIRGVIFDKDGTLFDFNATWASWAAQVIERETRGAPDRRAGLARALGFDLEARVFDAASVVIASSAFEIARVALPYLEDESVETVLQRWNVTAAQAPQIEATPLQPFLTKLRGAGIALGVATNDAEQPALAHLAAAGVLDQFDFIAGSDSGFGAKPQAGQLLAFCSKTGLATNHCAMVGDSTHDLRAGRAAGMTCIAVLTGIADHRTLAPHADVVLPSIADIPAWLGI